jgi:hypothetical protein
VAQPLTDCLKRGAKMKENDDTRKAFEQVKQLMINAPTLSLFNPEAEQIIETDVKWQIHFMVSTKINILIRQKGLFRSHHVVLMLLKCVIARRSVNCLQSCFCTEGIGVTFC